MDKTWVRIETDAEARMWSNEVAKGCEHPPWVYAVIPAILAILLSLQAAGVIRGLALTQLQHKWRRCRFTIVKGKHANMELVIRWHDSGQFEIVEYGNPNNVIWRGVTAIDFLVALTIFMV